MKLRRLKHRQSRVTRPFRHWDSIPKRSRFLYFTGSIGAVESVRLAFT